MSNPAPVKVPTRPLSPHLQIYKPQLTSVLSITHRATGIALSAGTLLLCYWIIAAARGPGAFGTAQALIGSPIGMLLLLGWSVSLFFHLSNGIRHLFWDAGYGYDLKTTYSSGYMVLVFTILLTALAWAGGLVFVGAL
jgi:succinate dehydrogenase / fumarate reductase cytochrome b subunit